VDKYLFLDIEKGDVCYNYIRKLAAKIYIVTSLIIYTALRERTLLVTRRYNDLGALKADRSSTNLTFS